MKAVIWIDLPDGVKAFSEKATEYLELATRFVNRPKTRKAMLKLDSNTCDFCDGFDQAEASYFLDGTSASICSVCVANMAAKIKAHKVLDKAARKKGKH